MSWLKAFDPLKELPSVRFCWDRYFSTQWELLLLPLCFFLLLPFFRKEALSSPKRELLPKRPLGLLVAGILVLEIFLAFLRWPSPSVADEFGYLLIADTFSKARLTNPAHALWEHFEALYVLHQPSYQAKYPPAIGAVLALGKSLFGHPIVGIWLSVAAFGAALYWMLLALFSRAVAFWGAAFWTLRFALTYWGQSYWGGMVSGVGGILVLGAFLRLRKALATKDLCLFLIGSFLLAHSRPYEGFFLCVVLAIILALRWRSARGSWAAVANLRTGAVIFVGIGTLLVYNHAVTGSAFEFPFVAYDRAYGGAPVFLWQKPLPKVEYRNEGLRDHFERRSPLLTYPQQRELGKFFLRVSEQKLLLIWEYFVGVALNFLWLYGLWASRKQGYGGTLILCTCLAGLVALSETLVFPHYLSPYAGVFILAVMLGIEQARQRGKKMRAFAAAQVLASLSSAILAYWVIYPETLSPTGAKRAQIERSVLQNPGKHLIVVRPSVSAEQYIYNGADIDSQRVIWARDLGKEKNERLKQYYSDRTAWLVNVD